MKPSSVYVCVCVWVKVRVCVCVCWSFAKVLQSFQIIFGYIIGIDNFASRQSMGIIRDIRTAPLSPSLSLFVQHTLYPSLSHTTRSISVAHADLHLYLSITSNLTILYTDTEKAKNSCKVIIQT